MGNFEPVICVAKKLNTVCNTVACINVTNMLRKTLLDRNKLMYLIDTNICINTGAKATTYVYKRNL